MPTSTNWKTISRPLKSFSCINYPKRRGRVKSPFKAFTRPLFYILSRHVPLRSLEDMRQWEIALWYLELVNLFRR